MKHRIAGREFNRTKEHRKALFKNLINALFLHGRIITTVEKAKEIRPKAEKIITIAKKSQDLTGAEYVHNFRKVLSMLQDQKIVKKVFSDLAERFDQRKGGYTRIIRLGASRWEAKGFGKVARNRLGDNAKRAIIELLERKDKDQELYSAGRGKLARQESESAKKPKATEEKK